MSDDFVKDVTEFFDVNEVVSDATKEALEDRRSSQRDTAITQVATALESIATAVHRISYGDVTGPAGLELLSMSLSGQGSNWEHNVASSLDRIAIAIGEHAGAAHDIAEGVNLLTETLGFALTGDHERAGDVARLLRRRRTS